MFYRFNQNEPSDQKWSNFFSRYKYLLLTKFEVEFSFEFLWPKGEADKTRFCIL